MRAWTRAMGDETTRGVGLGRMRRRRRRGGVRARDAGEWWFVDEPQFVDEPGFVGDGEPQSVDKPRFVDEPLLFFATDCT